MSSVKTRMSRRSLALLLAIFVVMAAALFLTDRWLQNDESVTQPAIEQVESLPTTGIMSDDLLVQDLTDAVMNGWQDPVNVVLDDYFTREERVDGYMARLTAALDTAHTPQARDDAFWGTSCAIWDETGSPLPFDGNEFWDYMREAGPVFLDLVSTGKMPYDLNEYIDMEFHRAFGDNPEPRCPS